VLEHVSFVMKGGKVYKDEIAQPARPSLSYDKLVQGVSMHLRVCGPRLHRLLKNT